MDILGIGNGLVDIFSFSDHEEALPLGLHPNSAAHVSCDRMDELLLLLRNPVYVSGGGATNALKAAAALGASCSFIGCTGTEEREEDHWSQIFRADLKDFNIKACIEARTQATGRCLVLHMPGFLKSIACAPGAAPTIKADQLAEELFSEAKIVHLDGQLLRYREVIERTSALCARFAIPLSIDIASADIARNYGQSVQSLFTRNDIILFMNADEAESLTLLIDKKNNQATDPLDIVYSFFCAGLPKKSDSEKLPCVVYKRGPLGAAAIFNGVRFDLDGKEGKVPLDDTGAGDCFAGAFLTGYLKGLEGHSLLSFADHAAREALSVPGSRLDRESFTRLGEQRF